MKKAIVTLVIGEQRLSFWNRICRKGWSAYCERCGYDLITVEQSFDTSERARARSPAWQKLLILSQPSATNYDRIVWCDSDICINPIAPSIIEGVPEEKIGAIDESTYPNVADHQAVVRSWGESAKLGDSEFFHTRVGLPGAQKHIVQTGVMVLSPSYHRSVLEHVYYTYEDAGTGSHFEMEFLSHELQSHSLQHWIDPRFNALLVFLIQVANLDTGRQPTASELRCFVMEQYLRNHFLHFAACRGLMPSLDFGA